MSVIHEPLPRKNYKKELVLFIRLVLDTELSAECLVLVLEMGKFGGVEGLAQGPQ